MAADLRTDLHRPIERFEFLVNASLQCHVEAVLVEGEFVVSWFFGIANFVLGQDYPGTR